MEVRRVAHYRAAAYPDKDAVRQDRSLLDTVPSRWKGNAAVCAALAITGSILLTGCEQGTVRMFRYGRGVVRPMPIYTTDTMGALMITPLPIVMDEAEAFHIITEEAEKEGLNLSWYSKEIEGAELPAAELNWRNVTTFANTAEGDFLLDGYNKEKNVAFEFVSAEDVAKWKAWKKIGVRNKDITLDIRAGAQALAKGLNEKTGDTVVGIFYDPVNITAERMEKMSREEREKFPEQSREDLRQQVRDFIAWLKAEGII